MSKLNVFLEEERAKRGMTKTDFCLFLGISRTTLFDIEKSGKAGLPTISTLSSRLKIARTKLVELQNEKE